MNRQIRPSTGNNRPAKRHTSPSQEQEKVVQNQIKDSSKFKERFQAIRLARELKPLPEKNCPPSDSKEIMQSGRSQLLERFNSIRCLKECMQDSQQTSEEDREREYFESNRKRIIFEDKMSTLSSHDSLPLSKVPPVQKTVLRRVPRTHAAAADHPNNKPTTAGIEFVTLSKIQPQELLPRLESKAQQNGQMTGYWKRQNRFVSLIPLQRNEKVSFEHRNILPIYAEVTLQGKRYVLSDQYKNCSLKNLLEEFGPFQEGLARKYLRQIAVGLQHMHYHRRAHNRIGPTSILYNQNGELFINAVRATSLVPSRQELNNSKELHSFAPDFLLSKGFSKSLKNDVWALGCLAILMLTNTGLTRCPIHPYNMTQQQFISAESSQMVDNLKQIHLNYFKEPPSEQKTYKNCQTKTFELSETATNFIKNCLQPLADDRPSIETLLEHQFFEALSN